MSDKKGDYILVHNSFRINIVCKSSNVIFLIIKGDERIFMSAWYPCIIMIIDIISSSEFQSLVPKIENDHTPVY